MKKDIKRKPIENAKFIFDCGPECAWVVDGQAFERSKTLKDGSIIQNVKRVNSNPNFMGESFNYEFNIVGETQKLACNYQWAFVLDNQINRNIIKQIQIINSKIKQLEKLRSLKIKEKGNNSFQKE